MSYRLIWQVLILTCPPAPTDTFLSLLAGGLLIYRRNEGLYLIVVYLFAVLNNAAASILSRPYISSKK
jgi:hypothetical protein